MIEVVTIVITRDVLTVQAVGKKIMKEEYHRKRRATIERIIGNFPAEAELRDRRELALLLQDLVGLGSTVRDIQEELNR